MNLDQKIAKAVKLGCTRVSVEPHEGRLKVFARCEKPSQPCGMSFGNYERAMNAALDEVIAKLEGRWSLSPDADPEAEALL